MELICRIIEQHPLQQRQYTDRKGQPQVFTSMGFTLASGTDTTRARPLFACYHRDARISFSPLYN